MSLGAVETAQEMRDIVRDIARGVIGDTVSQPRFGRVISIDFVSGNASVWFPGDESPVRVKFFTSNIPGDWQERYPFGVTNTSYEGYGSTVAVQTLNGTPYITSVLNGGQFSVDFRSINMGLVAQTPASGSSQGNLYGQEYETFFNVSVSSDAINDGGSLAFGPFTQVNGSAPEPGIIEVSVKMAGIGTKKYEFSLDPYWEMANLTATTRLDRWMRVLPAHAINDQNGQKGNWDFDVCLRQTAYGLSSDGATQNTELWFRIVKRGSAWTGIAADVTIRSGMIQKARSLDGTSRFIQEEILMEQTFIRGYLGFNNASHHFSSYDQYLIWDEFNRPSLVGQAPQVAWGASTDGSGTYTVASGTTANFYTSGSHGCIQATATGTWERIVNAKSLKNGEFFASYDVDAVATGASFTVEFDMRHASNNSRYMFKLFHLTTGKIDIALYKVVSGTESSVGATVLDAITYTANSTLNLRMQFRGTEFKLKIWSGSSEPVAWTISRTDSSITASGKIGFTLHREVSNTNTLLTVRFPYVRCYFAEEFSQSATPTWHTGPWRSSNLRVANDLQKTMIIDGAGFTWSGTHLKWTDIYLGGLGRSVNGLASGFANISCPVSGVTVLYFPANSTVSATADGIPLAAGESLWCAIPPEVPAIDLVDYLFVVNSDINAVEYHLPEWAVLVATRAPAIAAAGTHPIRLGDGSYLDVWKTTEVSSTSNSSAIGTTTTIVMSTASVTFPANTAFRVEFEGGVMGNTASAACHMGVYKGTTTTTRIFEFFRVPWIAASLPVASHESRIMKTSSAVTTEISLGITASTGTTTLWGSTETPRILRVTNIGPASDYPGAPTLT